MKLKNRTVVMLILSALLISAGSRAAAKDQSKHLANHRDDKAATQMSSKGTANNAQWSADPTRGWVRSAERKELRKPTVATNRDKAKQKTKGKGY